MNRQFLFVCIIFLTLCQPVAFPASPAFAQQAPPGQDGPWPAGKDYEPETSNQNICFTVTSDVDHTIYAQVISNYYRMEDGTWGRHRHNFRINKGEQYPVCTSGPFFNERHILIQVKSLIPLLSCYFDLGSGGRELRFYKREIAGQERLWATCKVVYPDISDLTGQ